MSRSGPETIFAIRSRIIELIDSATHSPELRQIGKILAVEFTKRKLIEGLPCLPEDVDIEASARTVLKRQVLCLTEGQSAFTPVEKIYLQQFADLVAKL